MGAGWELRGSRGHWWLGVGLEGVAVGDDGEIVEEKAKEWAAGASRWEAVVSGVARWDERGSEGRAEQALTAFRSPTPYSVHCLTEAGMAAQSRVSVTPPVTWEQAPLWA